MAPRNLQYHLGCLIGTSLGFAWMITLLNADSRAAPWVPGFFVGGLGVQIVLILRRASDCLKERRVAAAEET